MNFKLSGFVSYLIQIRCLINRMDQLYAMINIYKILDNIYIYLNLSKL